MTFPEPGDFMQANRIRSGDFIGQIILGGKWPMILGDGFEFEVEGVKQRLMAVRKSNYQEWIERYPHLIEQKPSPHYYEFIGD